MKLKAYFLTLLLAAGCTKHTETIREIEKSGGDTQATEDNGSLGVTNPQRGTADGGGGRVRVCYADDGSIKEVELLDLWEARTIYNRNILKSDLPWQQQVEDLEEKLNKSWFKTRGSGLHGKGFLPVEYKTVYEAIQLEIEKLQKNKKPITNAKLIPTNDSFEAIFPREKNCTVEQVVNYLPSGDVLFDEVLFNAMDETNKAALMVHEAVYALARYRSGDTNSIRSRRLVGIYFSDTEITERIPDVKNYQRDYISCFGFDDNPENSRASIVFHMFFHDNIPVIKFSSLGPRREMLTETLLEFGYSSWQGHPPYDNGVDGVVEKMSSNGMGRKWMFTRTDTNLTSLVDFDINVVLINSGADGLPYVETTVDGEAFKQSFRCEAVYQRKVQLRGGETVENFEFRKALHPFPENRINAVLGRFESYDVDEGLDRPWDQPEPIQFNH